jgi:TonB family protein
MALARAYAGAGEREKAAATASAALAAGAAGKLEKQARILRCENRPEVATDASELRKAGDPGVTRPEVVQRIQPRYPPELGRPRAEGIVIVDVVIDEQGCVTGAHLARSTDTSFDQATLDAIQRWVFRPAIYQGRPVKVSYTLTTSFGSEAGR